MHAASAVGATLTYCTNPSRGASMRRLPQQQQSCVDRHPLRLGTRNRTTPYCVCHTIARQSRCRLPPSALAHAATEKPAAVGHPAAATITLRQPGPLASTVVDSQAASLSHTWRRRCDACRPAPPRAALPPKRDEGPTATILASSAALPAHPARPLDVSFPPAAVVPSLIVDVRALHKDCQNA
jgi:hypothetical protein